MKNRNLEIEYQYNRPRLYEEIIERLLQQGVDLKKVSRSDLAGVDEFHVRGAEVSRELIEGLDISHQKVLDVGCGLGGPARMLADECKCQVWGIDINREFIRTAHGLSELAGLGTRTEFIQADALALPFDNASFNMVWTQHVQMNIEDKRKFYSEINRVLQSDGVFIYYDIFKREGADITYPVPWADSNYISFLQTIENMESILAELGFVREQCTDQTIKGIQFFKRILENTGDSRPPKVGLNLLMGGSTREKLGNLLQALEENKLVLQSGSYKKMAGQ